MSNVRMMDVAKKLGVSTNTISKALRNKKGVSQEKKDLILKTIDEMGYIPNYSAKTLKNNKSNTIAIVFDNFMNIYFMEMMDVLYGIFCIKKYDILIYRVVSHKLEEQDVKGLLSKGVEGILSFIEPDQKSVELIQKLKTPFVLLGRKVDIKGIDCVYSNDIMGGYKAGYALVKHGATNVGYFGGPHDLMCSNERLSGLKKCLNEFNVTIKEENIYHIYSQYYEKEAKQLLKSGVDGIFCFNDHMAYKLLNVAKKLNIKIPDDLILVGYDNIQENAPFSVQLTTIGTTKVDIASCAAEFLLDKQEDRIPFEETRSKEFEVFIVEGETT